MLQQTQVKTVIPYFKNFLQHFPTLESLSKANEKKVLKLWEGLGYYRRARNLLATAKILVKEHNSKLPNEIIDLKKLPGVGDYTANALLAFIYDHPTIAIDGNVKRVFSRILTKIKVNTSLRIRAAMEKEFIDQRIAGIASKKIDANLDRCTKEIRIIGLMKRKHILGSFFRTVERDDPDLLKEINKRDTLWGK